MSNEAEDILNEIQYKTSKTLDQIAAEIGYSRPYLNNIKLKGGGKKVIRKLKDKYKEILQNVSREVEDGRGPTDSELLRLLMQQMTNLMQTQNKLLKDQKESLVYKVDNIEANLNGLLIGQRSILANLEAGNQYELDREAGGDRAKAEKMQRELDRRIGEKMGVKQKMGNP